jgi:broad specificity phosphatase PhoE
LIRHGRPAAGFAEHPDPGLDDQGRAQAEAVAGTLLPLLPLVIYSSPLQRARETATPLANRCGGAVAIEPRMAEIPSPPEVPLALRGEWLRQVIAGRWEEQSESILLWYRAIADCLLSLDQNSAVFTHYLAINAAVAQATGDARVESFAPDHASVTVLEHDGEHLRVVQLGRAAATRVT